MCSKVLGEGYCIGMRLCSYGISFNRSTKYICVVEIMTGRFSESSAGCCWWGGWHYTRNWCLPCACASGWWEGRVCFSWHSWTPGRILNLLSVKLDSLWGYSKMNCFCLSWSRVDLFLLLDISTKTWSTQDIFEEIIIFCDQMYWTGI